MRPPAGKVLAISGPNNSDLGRLENFWAYDKKGYKENWLLKDENFLVSGTSGQIVSVPLSIYSGKSIYFQDYMESCAYFGDQLLRPCLK